MQYPLHVLKTLIFFLSSKVLSLGNANVVFVSNTSISLTTDGSNTDKAPVAENAWTHNIIRVRFFDRLYLSIAS